MHNLAKIIQCPGCEQKYRNKSVVYWLDREGKIWSDGYKSNDIANEFPLITRCDECYDYFWISDAGILRSTKSRLFCLALNHIEVSGKNNFQCVRKLTPEEYAEAIAIKKYRNQEEERYLRTNLWWAINTPFRNGKPAEISPELNPLFEENLETLIYKTPADSPENLLLLAEIHRELGLFNEAKQYLDHVTGNKYRKRIFKMNEKIKSQDKRVFLV
jgi:hypothetical protein